MTSGRLLDPDEALRCLETRLGPLHARLRLGIEREHEAQAFGQGSVFASGKLTLIQVIIEVALRVTGTYWWGRANAGKVELRRNTVCLPNLPSAFDGFTILHLSDLHADISGSAMRRTAELVLDLDYDLCVLTGDYRGRTYGDCMPCLEGVARLRRTSCVATSTPCSATMIRLPWFPTWKRLAFDTLLNECFAIQRGSASIYLAGVDDAHFYRADNIEKAAENIPPGQVSILLSHTPEIYRQAAHAGFDLMLSGHTHGGQICLPGGIPILLEADLPRAFGAGAWRHAGMAGYTSVGAGSSVVPVRFNNRPEITLHQLVRGVPQ